jgi:hypothetical protein
MRKEERNNEGKNGRMDVIKGIGWVLLPLLLGYLIFLLS